MIVFAGPTIAHAEIDAVLPGADIRPPARTGDIYKACQEMPEVIGLIDGFFEGVPAVWHKEILWAMMHGVAVFGASSMGALRAAELHAFGMIGVGQIFEAYRDCALEDDDEVALRHGPKEMGYVALSEPMVNIRASLDRAEKDGVLDRAVASDVKGVAKAMFFPDRSWDAVIVQAREAGVDGNDLERLQRWLPEGRVDQKKLDAVEMLDRMAASGEGADPEFEFQHTVMWEDLRRFCDRSGSSLSVILILDHLRQDSIRYADLRRRAADQLLSEADTDVPHARVDAAMTQFRAEHRLYSTAAFEDWLSENNLTRESFRERIAHDVMQSEFIAEDPNAFQGALLRLLKSTGQFEALSDVARQQAEVLQRTGFERPMPADIGLSSVSLLMWYFETYRGEPVPQDMDQFLHRHDYATRDDFEQMMARQYVLWQDQAQ